VRKPTGIADVLRDTARFVLSGSSVRCEFSIAPDLRPLHVDEGQISHVIENLVLNANTFFALPS